MVSLWLEGGKEKGIGWCDLSIRKKCDKEKSWIWWNVWRDEGRCIGIILRGR